MKKIVLVLVGQIGSGKWTVAHYLSSKYQLPLILYSQAFRDVLTRLGLEQSRVNIDTVSHALRSGFGQSVLGGSVAHEISSMQHDCIVLDGARREGDLTALGEHDVRIIYVDADPRTRHERVISRAQNPGDTVKTLDEFLADDANSVHVTIHDLKPKAWKVIMNTTSLEALHQSVDEIIKELSPHR